MEDLEDLEHLEQLEHLEHSEHLDHLEHLEPLEHLEHLDQHQALRIGHLIVVSLSRVPRKVLHELPVIALWIVEVHALPMRVSVRDSRLSVSG